MEESKKYIVAIDLGEANVVVAAGILDSEGVVSVKSIVSKPCEGVRRGMIENIALVEAALRSAVTEVESSLSIKIIEAYAGISGEFVRLASHSDHVYVSHPDNGVNQSDIDSLFDRMGHVQAPENETIMERIPQNYIVDESKEVKNPVGSFGSRLSSTFNFVLCGKTPMQRLENAFKKVNIKMLDSFPNTISVAESVLSSEEKEEGVAVVNIGAGLTDVTIYHHNVVRYIVSIPMGASAINADIRTMMIPEKCIDKLKCDYGSAVADAISPSKIIKVSGRTSRDSKSIISYNLSLAIEKIVTDLITFVKQEIGYSGYEEKIPYGIVVTGGSAKLRNIDELFRRLTDMEVRIGTPIECVATNSIAEVDDPSYATAVGILIRGAKLGACTTVSQIATPEYTTPVEPQSPKVVVTPPAQPVVPQPQTPPVTPRPTPSGTYTPPKPRPSETYVPPKPRPYSPPVSKPIPAVQPEPESVVENKIYNPLTQVATPDVEQPDAEVKNTKEQPKIKKGGFDMRGAFKGIFDKINKGFDGAEEEEI